LSLNAVTEAELQQLLIDAAELNGWLVFHDNDSRRNVAGFPDLVLVHGRHGRVLFLELKSEIGRLRPEQHVWTDALSRCDTIASAIVRPQHADRIINYLQNPESRNK
jgi:hypothetical protein